jgi:putative oxygen-independent coproporphyrinogen III oxidase
LNAAGPLCCAAAPSVAEALVAAVPLALYAHMPWCVRKCPYCDFNSHQLKSASPPRDYIDALIRDFDSELPGLEGRGIDAVFFGGGTPSLFSPDEFARLLEALRQRIAFAGDAEITLEANPGTVERGRFAGYRDAGINRVSLGAQSFAPHALERLGRIHTAEDTHRAVEELRAAGIDNFNLDLMYALPGQGLEEAIFDVRTACRLGPAHISYYQLTIEPDTVFHARPPPLPDEDAAWIIQTECQQILAAEGFEQYEVSAYAKHGMRCRHNLNYWLFGDYVGLGAGAHGKISSSVPDRILRTAKPKQPREYIERLSGSPTTGSPMAAGSATRSGPAPIGERKYIAAADLPFEFMLNALRLKDGFATRDFERRTGLPLSSIEPALRHAGNRGLLAAVADGWRPTALGARFLNDLQSSFLV